MEKGLDKTIENQASSATYLPTYLPTWNSFILGDCMEYMKLFPDDYFDLAMVDPVFGDVTRGGYTTKVHDKEQFHTGNTLANQKAYNRNIWEQPKTPPEYFKELFRISKNQIIWGGNFFVESLPSSQGWVVWDKKRPEGISFSDCEIAFTSFDVGIKCFRFMWNGMLQEDMKNKEVRIHPCHKPIALYKWLLKNYAKPGDKIIDTHVGGGSSLIACSQMGFDYIGFEIDPDYYEAAKERIEQETAQMTFFQMGLI